MSPSNRDALSIFRHSDLDTFETPTGMFDKLLASSLGPYATLLYLYLVRKASSYGAGLVRLYTGDVLNDTGMSRPLLARSRDELVTDGYITATETKRKGTWEYEVLNDDGSTLPRKDDWVDFRDFTSSQLEAYYADRLAVDKAPGRDEAALRFICPFHTSSSTRTKYDLQIATDGGKWHGRYICASKRCNGRGGLIDFETKIAAQKGRSVNRREATNAVKAFMARTAQPQTHPALADLNARDPDTADVTL